MIILGRWWETDGALESQKKIFKDHWCAQKKPINLKSHHLNVGCAQDLDSRTYRAVLVKLVAMLLSGRRLMFWLPSLQCDLPPGPGDDGVDLRQQPPLISSLLDERRLVWHLSQWILQHMMITCSNLFSVISWSSNQHLLLPSLSLSSLHTNSLSPSPCSDNILVSSHV